MAISDKYAVYANGQRWSPGRKSALVRKVSRGDLTLDQALEDHAITPEEFASWQERYAKHGEAGLKVTRLQVLA